MAIVFHEADDTCAPFPHRVLIKSERIIVARGIPITFPEQRFIICAECDHWILAMVACTCTQRCHDLGRMFLDLNDPEPRRAEPRHEPRDAVESGYKPDQLGHDHREARS